MKNIFLLLFLASFQISFAQNQLQLKPDSKYERSTETTSTTTMSMMGQEMQMNQEEKSTSIIEVIAEKNEAYDFQVTITEVSAKVSQMGHEESYDSTDEDAHKSPLAIAYDGHLNTARKMRIDKNGKITTMKEDDSEEMAEDFSGLQESFSIFIALPEDLEVGKTWTDQQKIKTDEMDLQVERTYTVKSLNDEEVHLQISGEMSLKQNIVNEGTRVNTKLNGTTAGEIFLYRTYNVVKSEKSFTRLKGNTHTSGMDIPITVETRINTELKEIQ